MKQIINFSSDAIGFENLSFFYNFVKNNNSNFSKLDYQNKNFEHLRYFYLDLKRNMETRNIYCIDQF